MDVRVLVYYTVDVLATDVAFSMSALHDSALRLLHELQDAKRTDEARAPREACNTVGLRSTDFPK